MDYFNVMYNLILKLLCERKKACILLLKKCIKTVYNCYSFLLQNRLIIYYCSQYCATLVLDRLFRFLSVFACSFIFLQPFLTCVLHPEQGDSCEDSMPVHMELLHSFHSLISSVEQLQSSFLFNPDKYNEGELATPPRRILNTLRYYWTICQ